MGYVQYRYKPAPEFKAYQKGRITEEEWKAVNSPVLSCTVSYENKPNESFVISAKEVTDFYGANDEINFKTIKAKTIWYDMSETDYLYYFPDRESSDAPDEVNTPFLSEPWPENVPYPFA